MTLEQKLMEIGIKRILVADDRAENIEAAREYFKDYKSIQVDYAWSAEEAKKKIQDAYSIQKYDFVLSDMQMEEKTSGQDVMREAAKHQALGIVITSRGPGSHGAKSWGEGTRMVCPCVEYLVETPKSQPETWEKIVEKSSEYMTEKGHDFFASLRRASKYLTKPSDEMSELIMFGYDFKEKL